MPLCTLFRLGREMHYSGKRGFCKFIVTFGNGAGSRKVQYRTVERHKMDLDHPVKGIPHSFTYMKLDVGAKGSVGISAPTYAGLQQAGTGQNQRTDLMK